MHVTFFIVPFIMLIPMSFYIYFYVTHMVKFWRKTPQESLTGEQKKDNIPRIIALIAIIVMWIFGHNFFGIGMFISLHIIAIGLILDLINLPMRKKKNRKWEKIYGSRLIPVILSLLILTYGLYHMADVQATYYSISVDKDMNQPYKIAMVADLHVGNALDDKDVAKYCKEISAEKPDLLVICGDLFDENTPKEYIESTCEALGGVETKYGVYYIYGNHDGKQFINAPEYSYEEMQTALKESDITILKDEDVLINDDIYLVGREDAAYMEANRKTTKELMANVDTKRAVIILDHQVNATEENSKAGGDLQLSGHTHGGQIMPIGILAEMVGIFDINQGYGEVGNMQAIVTSGMSGYGEPVRTEGKSEYVIINLTEKKAK